MTPEIIKAFTEAGMALTVVVLSGALGYKLLSVLFGYLGGQSNTTSGAWKESVEMLQSAWSENTRSIQEQTSVIRSLAQEIKEDRRFWTQMIAQSQERVLREIRREMASDETNGSKFKSQELRREPNNALEPKAQPLGFTRDAQSRLSTTDTRSSGGSSYLNQPEQLARRYSRN